MEFNSSPSLAEIRAIEIEAHRMRSEACAAMMSALFGAIARMIKAPFALVRTQAA